MSVRMIGLDRSTRGPSPSFPRPCIDLFVVIIRPLNHNARMIDKADGLDHKSARRFPEGPVILLMIVGQPRSAPMSGWLL